MEGMQNDLSQKIDNIQYSISRLTNLNTVTEKGKFPFQPSQNPKGVHEVETQDGESSKLREVKAVITLRSGKEVDQPLPKVRQDEELLSKRTLVKESNNQEEKSGKNASKSSIEEEPKIDLCTVKRGLHVTKNAFLTEQVSAIIQIQVDKFYYPVDFVVLDTDPTIKEANYVPIILGRPFLATSNAIINCRNGVMQLTFGNMTLELNIFHLCKRHLHPEEEEGLEEVFNTLVEEHCDKNLEKRLNESLGVLEEGLPEPSEEDEKCPVVVSSNLTSDQEDSLLGVLRKCKKVIGWQISDLKGISPLVCTHHIYMEEDAKPVRQPQRRLNPHMQEVVRGEVLKLLQARIIYPISDSLWVSPTQVVPKKSGITVIQNEKGEEFSTRPTSGWRIDLEDQEKTTFTCPFGTFAYRRMPFGLCNAPATFQRCMLSIFSDMVERIMEIFMDDITVYGGSYEECLLHLEDVLQRCIEKDLVLNWEKCHFMVQQGIVLGHIISKNGIEDAKFVWDEKCQKSFEELKQFLTTAPIAQRNYTTTEKELLVLVFALDKFRAYLVGSFIVVFTDHSALKYLLTKQDAKGRLIRWILLLQEFNLQIRDKKGVENVVADHLSRLVIAHDSHGLPINDDFPEESLMSIEVAPWYSHIANYLVTGEVPSEWSAQDKRHFFAKIHAYYWEEPFLFKYCADQIIRKCVPEQEQSGILSHCHDSACGGHFAS
ncbi:Retrovirus-related Pol polyprotein from transposon 17.6 [Vitis vinifera]|uniref:RNA-directed DNA polymerase n=1 Tax=Vitis vinifera TaxID=29760 RepID=A0A438BPJ6_VITVI|nr:Retrovirus-related Pol polyprotein from transposon 17.6 [Vitis vinifera]